MFKGGPRGLFLPSLKQTFSDGKHNGEILSLNLTGLSSLSRAISLFQS